MKITPPVKPSVTPAEIEKRPVTCKIDGSEQMVQFKDLDAFAAFVVLMAEEIPHGKRFGTTAK